MLVNQPIPINLTLTLKLKEDWIGDLYGVIIVDNVIYKQFLNVFPSAFVGHSYMNGIQGDKCIGSIFVEYNATILLIGFSMITKIC